LGVVGALADRLAVMYAGRLVESGDARRVLAAPRHPYTQALLAAIPVPEPGVSRPRAVLGGDVPNPIAPPPGCAFHTRCPHVRDACRQQVPALADDGGHATACIRWRDIAPSRQWVPAGAPGEDERLRRLQSAFVVPDWQRSSAARRGSCEPERNPSGEGSRSG
ncbi:MAG: oligopeptide/dipeptide ABC transporter ATP-binding protein, partial [Rhizobacter sp.]